MINSGFSYPSNDCKDISLLSSGNIRGEFSDLSVRKAIAKQKENLKEISALFTWEDSETGSIDKLKFEDNRFSIETKNPR